MGKSKEFEAMKGRFAKRTTEEQRETARQGGIKSGEVRKEKKSIKEALQDILSEEVETKSGDKVTIAYIIAHKLITKAKDGDCRAMEILLKYLEGNKSVTVNTEDKSVTFAWVDE